MSNYRIAAGHDQALIDLDPITPQPRSEGVKALRRTYAAGGTVYEEGKYIELAWNVLGGATSYQAILTQFGLDAAATAQVTLYVPDYNFAYARYNGTAVRPLVGEDIAQRNYFLRNVVILVRDLEYST